jgi:hypothetical protein
MRRSLARRPLDMSRPDATGGQPRANQLDRKRQVAEKFRMRSRRAVRGLAGGLLQVANDVARIEVIKERAVVQESTAASPLRVPRDLSPVQRKIGVSSNRNAGYT